MTTSVTIELPDRLVEIVGSPEGTADLARQALVLALLRGGTLSHGQAAEMLGLSLWDSLPMAAEAGVRMGPQTPEELREEVESLRQMMSRTSRP